VAPVIRISDEVFRRLQKLSEPLVDTPSSVIERVLAHYETSRSTESRLAVVARVSEKVHAETPITTEQPPRLYLVPASRENLRVSVQRGIPLKTASEILSAEQLNVLARAVAPLQEFRCWAATEASKAVFESMKAGDIVLLTAKGTGKFDYRARIITKLVSESLAQKIWPVAPGLPWKFIYVLGDVQPISISKERLVSALGYDPSYWVPGHLRVNAQKLTSAIREHGSVEELLNHCHT
jgi:predicted transcriptional regulator